MSAKNATRGASSVHATECLCSACQYFDCLGQSVPWTVPYGWWGRPLTSHDLAFLTFAWGVGGFIVTVTGIMPVALIKCLYGFEVAVIVSSRRILGMGGLLGFAFRLLLLILFLCLSRARCLSASAFCSHKQIVLGGRRLRKANAVSLM